MQLHEYLASEKVPIPAFAEQISVSVQAVHRYLSGDRIPRVDVMDRIKTATDGKVQPNDFYASRQQAAE
jgi:hypothetical protein